MPDAPIAAAALLALLTALTLKHFLCDFVLQTGYQASNKGRYGHPGGLLHAGCHALGTVAALGALVGLGLLPRRLAEPSLLAAVAAAEFVIHYHIDWAKQAVGARVRSTPADHGFWVLFGFDQLLHHLTYLGFAAWVASG